MNSTETIFGRLNNDQHWYALRTRSRHEKKVDARLRQSGISSYLPLNTRHRRWSDRIKVIEEPLFSCYVFVYLALRDRLSALRTDGAVNLVCFNGIPARIPAEQIEALKWVLQQQPDVKRADYFTPGEKVEVVAGPLKGLTGTLQRINNRKRLLIAIDGIMQAVSVRIDPHEVKRIAKE